VKKPPSFHLRIFPSSQRWISSLPLPSLLHTGQDRTGPVPVPGPACTARPPQGLQRDTTASEPVRRARTRQTMLLSSLPGPRSKTPAHAQLPAGRAGHRVVSAGPDARRTKSSSIMCLLQFLPPGLTGRAEAFEGHWTLYGHKLRTAGPNPLIIAEHLSARRELAVAVVSDRPLEATERYHYSAVDS
jgi:hypothetical protein